MDDRLCFFSLSADKPAGQGSGEHAADDTLYEPLNKIRNWRRVLSNFHPVSADPIAWRDLTFRSVEHAYQYTKVALAKPEQAKLFSIESGSGLSKTDGPEVKKAGRLWKLSKEQICRWDWNSLRVMTRLVEAKAKVCPLFRQTLLATRSAQLWHLRPRQDPQRWSWMELIRTRLQKGKVNLVEGLKGSVSKCCCVCAEAEQ